MITLGWRFAVSADINPQLRAEIEALPVKEWHFRAEERGGAVREWVDVQVLTYDLLELLKRWAKLVNRSGSNSPTVSFFNIDNAI